MKRICLLIVMLGTLWPAVAQKNSRIGEVLDELRRHPNATEVVVKGKELKPYKLSYFRSVTVNPRHADLGSILRLVKEASDKAMDKEEGLLGGELYYGFYCLPPVKEQNRYLFYRNATLKKGTPRSEVTLVYMEGYATLEQLKEMFR